jgi:FkbM family methyltransferase
MLKALKRAISPHVLGIMRQVLAEYNYEIIRRPQVLRRIPTAELSVSLDLVLADYLTKASSICFVQVGGFDGKTGDPLYPYVTKYQWKGVIVEPQTEAFEALKSNYANEPQIILANAAVADHDGFQTLWRLRSGVQGLPAWAPQLASFDRDTVLRHKAQIPNIEEFIEAKQVRCVTLDTLMRESGLDRIDVLQIDVEGYDYEILKLLDFEKYKPSIIRYEHAHLHPDDLDACLDMLVQHGYKVGFEQHDTIAYAERHVR